MKGLSFVTLSLLIVLAASVSLADSFGIMMEGFDDGSFERWTDAAICYDDNFSFEVIWSDFDGSYVLKHEGGTEWGGGNREAYLPGLSAREAYIEADIRNVEAWHKTAKAMGLALRINETTGEQYLCWLTVSGDLFLYKTRSWTACGPGFLTKTKIDSIGEGDLFHLSFGVVGNTLSVSVNGMLQFTYTDVNPLPAGSAGVVATAGITYFDNISVVDNNRAMFEVAATWGRIKTDFTE